MGYREALEEIAAMANEDTTEQAHDMVEIAQDALDAGEWQDISAAPKDGSRVLLYVDHEHGDKVWTGLWASGWVLSYGRAEVEPTHWMNLPEPPKE